MLMLLYGRAGWFAQAIAENGWNIVFAFPGMCMADPLNTAY
jgi:ABC-type sulfate transport system permease subunit